MYTWRVHLLEHSEGTALVLIDAPHRAKEGAHPNERLLVAVFQSNDVAVAQREQPPREGCSLTRDIPPMCNKVHSNFTCQVMLCVHLRLVKGVLVVSCGAFCRFLQSKQP